jgi:hypothetical protein
MVIATPYKEDNIIPRSQDDALGKRVLQSLTYITVIEEKCIGRDTSLHTIHPLGLLEYFSRANTRRLGLSDK